MLKSVSAPEVGDDGDQKQWGRGDSVGIVPPPSCPLHVWPLLCPSHDAEIRAPYLSGLSENRIKLLDTSLMCVLGNWLISSDGLQLIHSLFLQIFSVPLPLPVLLRSVKCVCGAWWWHLAGLWGPVHFFAFCFLNWAIFFLFVCFTFWPCHVACGTLVLWPGIDLVALQWKLRVLTTGPPEKSRLDSLKTFRLTYSFLFLLKSAFEPLKRIFHFS